jgi:hypothetical protein
MRSLLVNDPRNAGTQWADFELDSFAAAHESGIGPSATCQLARAMSPFGSNPGDMSAC